MLPRLFVVLAVLCVPDVLRPQCPNGTPPPCAHRRPQTQSPPPPAVRARSFIVLPFKNVTRIADQDWLATGGPLMLAQIIGQFTDLHVVPEEQLLAASRKLGVNAGAADATQLRALAAETGGWTAISGDVIATRTNTRITARALDIATSRVIARAEADIAPAGDPRAAFDSIAARLLAPAGAPAGAVSLESITTHSLEAFRAYARGLELYQRSRFREAEAEFERAVQLDTAFALAWHAIAATAVSSGGVQIITNPQSRAYRAIEHAMRHSNRLPAREARFVRAIHAMFRGEIRRARRQLDSLFAEHPDHLDVAYWVAVSQLFGVPVDTTALPMRLQSSPNRAVRIAEMVLERDPKRRTAYMPAWIAYAFGAGLWWGDIYGHRREYPSYAATLMALPDAREVPVLVGDTLQLMPRAIFDSLPVAQQDSLRRRSADVAWQWSERAVLAAPDDADPHIMASHTAELRGDYARALRELNIADSLGIQSAMDNIVGRRLSLILKAGRVADAAAMADSLLAAGTLTPTPFLRVFDRRRGYGAAALLLTKRFDSVARMVRDMETIQDPGCRSLRKEMMGYRDAWLPQSIRRAIMDTVKANVALVSANPVLRPCVLALSDSLHR